MAVASYHPIPALCWLHHTSFGFEGRFLTQQPYENSHDAAPPARTHDNYAVTAVTHNPAGSPLVDALWDGHVAVLHILFKPLWS